MDSPGLLRMWDLKRLVYETLSSNWWTLLDYSACETWRKCSKEVAVSIFKQCVTEDKQNARARLIEGFVGGWQRCVPYIVRMDTSAWSHLEKMIEDNQVHQKMCEKQAYVLKELWGVRTKISFGHGIDRNGWNSAIWVYSGLIPLTITSEMMCDFLTIQRRSYLQVVYNSLSLSLSHTHARTHTHTHNMVH